MTNNIGEQYDGTRQNTLDICNGLTTEDMTAQSMPDASPSKWHLAHTTWFFETFILKAFAPQYNIYNAHFADLFNSYYQSVGNPFLRPNRGLLTRPALTDIFAYRTHVDRAMQKLLDNTNEQINCLTTVGLHHEMQHQELLLTDILHLLAHNPTHPRIKNPAQHHSKKTASNPLHFVKFDEQKIYAGANNTGFSYDCEKPQHATWLTPFSLGNRLITNREWLAFMQDDGYNNSLLWLSDGWACAKENLWVAPLYWQNTNDEWQQFGLDGLHPISLDAPVCHISYYEAEAFARWAGKRLPKEHELEFCQTQCAIEGNFLEQAQWRPQPASIENANSDTTNAVTSNITQLYGDVWEWTQSAFLPYPKFRPENGALGEYNGKFMANQMVLKGGSCVTPKAQMRPSYRNFFHPHQRWQFTGLRLAEDN